MTISHCSHMQQHYNPICCPYGQVLATSLAVTPTESSTTSHVIPPAPTPEPLHRSKVPISHHPANICPANFGARWLEFMGFITTCRRPPPMCYNHHYAYEPWPGSHLTDTEPSDTLVNQTDTTCPSPRLSCWHIFCRFVPWPACSSRPDFRGFKLSRSNTKDQSCRHLFFSGSWGNPVWVGHPHAWQRTLCLQAPQLGPGLYKPHVHMWSSEGPS